MKSLNRLLALAAVSISAAVSSQAGTYANINLDGDTSDWSGITASATNTGTGPINQIFVSNNDSYLYLLITFNTPTNILTDGFRLNIDSDNNLSTGFNTFGLSLIGSEVLFEGETAYQQAIGNYNTGAPTNAPLLVTNYGSAVTSVELGIARSALIDTGNSTLVFPAGSFGLAAYFDGAAAGSGSTSFTSAGTYSLAAIPEPSAFAALAGLGVLGLAAVRRRR